VRNWLGNEARLPADLPQQRTSEPRRMTDVRRRRQLSLPRRTAQPVL